MHLCRNKYIINVKNKKIAKQMKNRKTKQKLRKGGLKIKIDFDLNVI
jgi:hypothetical protein